MGLRAAHAGRGRGRRAHAQIQGCKARRRAYVGPPPPPPPRAGARRPAGGGARMSPAPRARGSGSAPFYVVIDVREGVRRRAWLPAGHARDKAAKWIWESLYKNGIGAAQIRSDQIAADRRGSAASLMQARACTGAAARGLGWRGPAPARLWRERGLWRGGRACAPPARWGQGHGLWAVGAPAAPPAGPGARGRARCAPPPRHGRAAPPEARGAAVARRRGGGRGSRERGARGVSGREACGSHMGVCVCVGRGRCWPFDHASCQASRRCGESVSAVPVCSGGRAATRVLLPRVASGRRARARGPRAGGGAPRRPRTPKFQFRFVKGRARHG